jgi:hypothetical protein
MAASRRPGGLPRPVRDHQPLCPRTGRVSRTCACQAVQPGGQCPGEAEPRVELVELEAGHGVDVAVATTVFSAAECPVLDTGA